MYIRSYFLPSYTKNHMRKRFWLIFFITLIGPYFTYSQEFDPDFSINLISPEAPWISDYYQQNDGKIIVVSEGLYVNGDFTGGITRFNPDFTLDTSFSSPFLTVKSSPGSIALQSDGKIIVSGIFEPKSEGVVLRLNTDGSIDKVLIEGIHNRLNKVSVAVDSQDNIFVFGSFLRTDYGNSRRLLKLLPNGDVDQDFHDNGVLATEYANLIIQEDDKILIAGTDNRFNNLYRINTDGTIDTGFNYPYNVADVRKIHRINDKYIITGRATDALPGIARLNDNGSFDDTFNYQNESTDYAVFSAIQPDGRILLAHDKYIYRLQPNGVIDNSFTPVNFRNNPRPPYRYVPLLLLSDGSFLTQNLRLINPDSEELPIPDLIPGSFPHVTTISLNHRGNLVFGGRIDGEGSFAHQPVMIMDEQKNVDSRFLVEGSYQVFDVGEYDDGEYLVSAKRSNPNGAFFKLDSKGKVDLNFKARDVIESAMQSGFDGTVRGFEKQADGKMLVYGQFAIGRAFYVNKHIVRLHEDGTFDDTFRMSNSLNIINDVLTLSNGESFVAGYGTHTEPIAYYIKSNGWRNFSISHKRFVNAAINKVKLDQSGNIYFAGDFSEIARYRTRGLIKVKPDFKVDTTFRVEGEHIRLIFSDFEILENGKILAVGSILNTNTFKKLYTPVITLLNEDGSVDESFQHDFHWLGAVTEIFSTKKYIYVGGWFVQDEAFTSSGLIRFKKDYLPEEPEEPIEPEEPEEPIEPEEPEEPEAPIDPQEPESPEEPVITGVDDPHTINNQIKVYPNPAFKSLTISLENAAGGHYQLDIINSLGQSVYHRSFQRKNVSNNLIIPIGNFRPGIYQIRLIGEKKLVEKLIIR